MYQVSIVILNWNGIKDTLECLSSIRKLRSTNYKLQVIVVDNGSTDNSRTLLRKEKKITLLENKKNLGYAGGNNVGIRYAVENGADFILLLNNDTTVSESFLNKFLDAAESHKEGGVFSPKIYFAKGYEYHKEDYHPNELGKVIWYAGGIIDWKNVLGSNYGVDDVDVGQYHVIRKIDFATGACVFLRREVIETIGYLNERYFLYLEDVDYSIRARQAGWKILFVPDSHIWHKVSQSSGIGGASNDYYITRNRLLFGLTYAPIRSKIALLRESIKLLLAGRPWQKKGVIDFYKQSFGKGSFSQ